MHVWNRIIPHPKQYNFLVEISRIHVIIKNNEICVSERSCRRGTPADQEERMKQGKWVVSVFTVLLILAAFVIGKSELGRRNFPFSVMVVMDGEEKEIPCYDMWGDYYVFLPSYAQQAQVTIRANPVYDIYIEDQLLTEGLPCEQFPTDRKLDLFYYTASGEPDGTVTFLRSENAGTVYIDVRPGGIEYVHEKKGNETGGHIQIYDPEGRLWHKGTLESLRGRGNATWVWDKKPYSLTLGNPANLLGMGEAEEWILLSNAPDPSHLRNKIAYDLASEVGLSYSPESRWVDVYFNGVYTGLYLLTERNELHPQRIAVPSGSFVVSMELESRLQEQNYPYIRTNRGTVLRIHQSEISHPSIQQIWESAENAIFAEDGIDPITGKFWTDLIDLDSWVKKYLLEETLGNYDAASVSQYFYYDPSTRKLYAGPVWDMDNSMGASEWIGLPNAILAGREHLWSDEDAPLYHALLEKAVFQERAQQLYRQVYQPALKQLNETKLNAYAAKILKAAQMNRVRWPEISPQTDPEDLRSYLTSRMAFLGTYLENRADYIQISAWIPGNIWFSWALKPGETLEYLTEGDGYAWYDLKTGSRFDFKTSVYHNMILQKRQSVEREAP